MANARDRSKVILFNRNASTGNFKRPDHPDYLTTTELKQKKFTGWRLNSISGNAELWLEGEIDIIVTKQEMDMNPTAVEDAHAKRFGFI